MLYPIFASFARWVWTDDPNVSPEFCMEDGGIFAIHGNECWSRLAAKLLGILIIAASCICKAPMIVNLCKSKSVAGLSKQALYSELVLFANPAAYGILEGHPFTNYGENAAQLIQSAVLVLVAWRFSDPPITSAERRLAWLLCVGYVIGVSSMLPALGCNSFLNSSVLALILYSRGAQIWENFRVQHTGAQSFVTYGFNAAGCLARVFTTLKEVGVDSMLLSTFVAGVVTNTVLLLQLVVYRRNTKHFLQSLPTDNSGTLEESELLHHKL